MNALRQNGRRRVSVNHTHTIPQTYSIAGAAVSAFSRMASACPGAKRQSTVRPILLTRSGLDYSKFVSW